MRHSRKTGCVLVAAAVFLLLAAVEIRPASADQVSELLALADNIRNDTPGIGFQIWTEGEKDTFQISDRVVFGFSADRDCYVGIINIGTSGKTTLLFPNKWHTDNKIEKDRTYRIPPDGSDYAVKLVGPAGTELIKVIACIDPILGNVESLQKELKAPLEQNPADGGTFLTMKNAPLVLKDVAVLLDKVDSSKWATVDMPFEVVEGGSSSQKGSSPESPQTPVGQTPSKPAQR